MILEEKYTLYNGVKIPKLGLGTWLVIMETPTSFLYSQSITRIIHKEILLYARQINNKWMNCLSTNIHEKSGIKDYAIR